MRAIGIDLGTTNSVAAFCEPDRRDPKVLSNSSGENLTPSAVSVRRSKRDGGPGELLVGRAALNYGPSAPQDTVLSIKRLMGRDYADPQVAEVANRFSYTVVQGPGEDPRAHVRLDGRTYTPAQISAMILRKIQEDASRVLGEEVTHAVITVPAYFTESQRAATREAGEQAGLVVKKIIDEPTAAAIAFGVQCPPGERHRILVYDLGGGTFDISILQMVKDQRGEDQFQILQIEGDTWLGGDDFDRQIVERIIERVKEETGEDPSGDKRFLFLAKKHAEEAKRALSHATEIDVVIPAAYRTVQGATVDVELPLRREELENMIEGYVVRSMERVQKALSDQSLSPEDISDILLVGGATLTPRVYRTVESVFGAAKVRRNVNPMECVALGASILAAKLRSVECAQCGEVNDETATACKKCGRSLVGARAVGSGGLTEVTAMSLGIAAVKGTQRDVFVPIIPKGTPYPLHEPMKQSFQAANRKLIKVPVYEGDEPVASRNAEVGLIEYQLPQEIDLDSRVEVSFNYDQDRLLTVKISVPGTSLFKTETLRRDRPRTPRPSEQVAAEAEESWLDELADTLEFAQRFLENYETYMETTQSMTLRREIDKAKQLLIYQDEVEGRRMIRILQRDVFNCGLATQLFLADRAVTGAPPEEAQKVSEAARAVRQSHERGERERAAEQARMLRVLVAKTLERRAGIQGIADQEDYGGLLKMLTR